VTRVINAGSGQEGVRGLHDADLGQPQEPQFSKLTEKEQLSVLFLTPGSLLPRLGFGGFYSAWVVFQC